MNFVFNFVKKITWHANVKLLNTNFWNSFQIKISENSLQNNFIIIDLSIAHSLQGRDHNDFCTSHATSLHRSANK